MSARKVLISLDEALLRKIDRAARSSGKSRSAYIAGLAARDAPSGRRPDPRVRAALDRLDRLFADNPVPRGDVTADIRRMRDER